MYERQPGNRFGAEYQAAQRATPKEAPSVSRATILNAAKIGGRELHLLSAPEFAAALVALYHPQVFDLQEQRLLSPGPAQHPLVGHPRAIGLGLPSLPGTVEIMDQLGQADKHPTIIDKRQRDPGEWRRVPWPYIGDLLLFLEDAQGPYCVNWTVKGDSASFVSRGDLGPRPSRRDAIDPAVVLRHEVERLHYAAAGIRTVQIVGSQFEPDLIANLRILFTHHARRIDCTPSQHRAVVDLLGAAIGTEMVMASVLSQVSRRLGIDAFAARAILYQSVWNRQLRIDLFQPIVADHPLLPEQEDLCSRYASLFSRGPA